MTSTKTWMQVNITNINYSGAWFEFYMLVKLSLVGKGFMRRDYISPKAMKNGLVYNSHSRFNRYLTAEGNLTNTLTEKGLRIWRPSIFRLPQILYTVTCIVFYHLLSTWSMMFNEAWVLNGASNNTSSMHIHFEPVGIISSGSRIFSGSIQAITLLWRPLQLVMLDMLVDNKEDLPNLLVLI